jgi:hypothetical protein
MRNNELINNEASSSTLAEGFSLMITKDINKSIEIIKKQKLTKKSVRKAQE